MRSSDRLPSEASPNRLASTLARLRARGVAVVDLTESNPTRVGIPYPDDLLVPLSTPRGLTYDPHPLGLAPARAAVAADCARRGATVDPADVVLSASTSDAYAWLFKLLCNPGDAVLVPRPSYPLFDHLTRLEGVRAVPYSLTYHGRWDVDPASLTTAPSDVRAVLAVSPNNPTGSYVSATDRDVLVEFCRQREIPLIVDEVFADYPLDLDAPLTDLAAHADGVLTFTLAGFSKSLGLPQLKLAWIVVGGPPAERVAALAALELIADTYLSVGTPIQEAAPVLLERAAPVRDALRNRVQENLRIARQEAVVRPACEVLPAEGGWSAVLRIPAIDGEERFVLDLLEQERILVHPGYFFDFMTEAFVVISLLPPPEMFADAWRRLLARADR